MGEALMVLVLKLFDLNGFDPRKQNILAKIKGLLTIINFLTLFGLNLSEIVFNWQGVQTLEETYYLPLLFLYTTKSIVLFTNQKIFLKLITKTTEFWKIDDFDGDLKCDLKKLDLKVLRCGKSFMILCYLTGVLLMIDPIVNKSGKPVFPGYQFCNVEYSPCYEITWIWHGVIIFLYIVPVCPGLDTFFCSLISYMYSTFKLISFEMNEITKIINSHKCNPRILRAKLRAVVMQHNVILECISLINKFFMQLILVQFLFCFGTLITCLYMVTKENLEFEKRIKFGTNYVLLITTLLMYSLGGVIIMEESKSIAFKAYNIEWYKTDTELWKNLSLIIQRANNVPSIKIGNLVDLTLEPFVSVLKNSLSCYMFIKTLENQ